MYDPSLTIFGNVLPGVCVGLARGVLGSRQEGREALIACRGVQALAEMVRCGSKHGQEDAAATLLALIYRLGASLPAFVSCHPTPGFCLHSGLGAKLCVVCCMYDAPVFLFFFSFSL